MKTNKTKSKTNLQLLLLTTVMLLGYQNCGPGILNSSTQSSTDGGAGPGTFTTTGDGVTEIIDSKTVGISYSENTFSSMQNQTGVTAPSTNTRNAVTAQFTKLPETGRSDSVTAPMWVSITTVAGELCTDLVTQERGLAAAQRRFYGQINFTTGPESITAGAKDDVIRRLARSFWARNETPQEKALILSALNGQFTSTVAADTNNAAMFVCTAMLSSLDAHKY
ncbi:MAG: hypothetical protein AAB250_12195 [Bdellovibrionota bacterium]